MEEVAGDLLALGEVELVLLVVHEEGLALPRLVDFGADEFAHAVLVLVVERVVLEFEDFSGQCLSEGEDGAASEVGEVDFLCHVFAHLVVRCDLSRLCE